MNQAQAAFPHDDTASLIAFYGRPWSDMTLLIHVTPPFVLRYDGAEVHAVLIHKRCADALAGAFAAIWSASGGDQSQIDQWGISNYSGSFNYRNVRGAGNLSCHAFGAALDFDADAMPLGSLKRWPEPIIAAFTGAGAWWGGDFLQRKDPMHFQFAHEG